MALDLFFTTLRLFLSSIIFIIGAYLLQRLSDDEKWKSGFADSIKNILTILSIASLLGSVLLYIILSRTMN